MKTNSLLRIILFVIIAGLLFLSCSPTGTSSVTIHINLGLDNKAAFNAPESSIIDRILRFFAKDVKAQTAPLGITSIGLSVTGEGMSVINNTYPADTSTITLDVLAGPARVFQVTAYRPTGDWGGSSAAYDLEAGQSVEIPITMAAQYANVTINPAYPNGTPASTTLTYTVNVTTSGQVVLSSSFTPGTPINVPAGASKDFEVLVNTPSVTFRGTSSSDLAVGSSQTVAPDMTLYETKIVIPDASNNRICQIDNINGGWATPLYNSNIGYSNTFQPRDVDFDASGRIYIANTYQGTGSVVVLGLNDITATSYDPIIIESQVSTSVYSLSIDRINNLLYFATSSQLYRLNLTTAVLKSDFNMGITTTISTVRGMSVDNNGILYIAGTISLGTNMIFKYDTAANGGNGDVIDTYTPSLSNVYDTIYKDNNTIYIANRDGGAGYKIIQIDSNMNLLDNNGNASSTADSVPGNFYGPMTFLAILNRGFIIIDEHTMNDTPNFTGNRLVYFDDISLTGWQTFGVTGSGNNQFNFYWEC